MNRVLTFIPVAADELGAIVGQPELSQRSAFSVTAELLAELGYEESHSEDAEYAALVLASVAGLTQYGVRLVLVAEVAESLLTPGSEPHNGEVFLKVCPQASITAWFCDEPGADVAAVAQVVEGMSIDEAWERPELQALLAEHDLLWNDVVEFRRAKG